MPRKNKHAIELLPPTVPTGADLSRLIAQAVEQKVAEVMSGGSDAVFQPFFQSREITNRIRDRQTVTAQNKWRYYFEKWGCVACGTKDTIHRALGMCNRCHQRILLRLQAIIRKHTPANPSMPNFTDSVRLAREALGPALKALPPGSTTRRRPK